MLFGFSQVAIDLEPLIRLLRVDSVLHGPSHSYLGATIIGVLSLFIGKPICEYFLRRWNVSLPRKWKWLHIAPAISWRAASIGTFIGVYSHVVLDSIMHLDMRPWWPLSEANGLLHIISIGNLHLLCIVLGGFGLLALVFIWLWNKWTIEIE